MKKLPSMENQRPVGNEIKTVIKSHVLINNHKTLYEVIKKIYEIEWNNIKSIADFGCSTGELLTIIDNDHPDYRELVGIDAFSELRDNSDVKNFIIIDLRKEFDLKQKFDLLICTEVGEHIDARYIKSFVKNIRRHTSKYLLMSWSPTSKKTYPTSRDRYNRHISPLKNKNFIKLMYKYGFKIDTEKELILQNKVKNSKSFRAAFPQIHVFVKEKI